MKYLVPIDFTDIAYNALRYALKVCDKDDEMSIVHVWSALLSVNEPIILSPGLTKEDGVKKEIQAMVEEARDGSNGPEEIDIILAIGNQVNAIVKESESQDYDAIIMGTRDKYDLLDKLFGTISLGVIKKSTIPVYLIPKDVTYQKPKSVFVATDQHFESDEVIEQLLEWNEPYQAALKFYHIRESFDKEYKYRENIIEELLDKRNLSYGVSIEEIRSDNVSKTIIETSEKEKCNLIVIVADTQSWLDTVLTRSITKELILKTKTPILFLHSKKRKPIIKDIPIL